MDTIWQSEWLGRRTFYTKRESFHGRIFHGRAIGSKAGSKAGSYIRNESFYGQILYGGAHCSKADTEWIWRWMLLMTVYFYNGNTHGRHKWEEWSEKANQNIFITEGTPTGGNSGRTEECLLKSWKNIECYYKTHTHGEQEWEETNIHTHGEQEWEERNINNRLCDLEQACEHSDDHARLWNSFDTAVTVSIWLYLG